MKPLKNFIIILSLFLGATSQADPVAAHGMVLFGNTTTYASHLSMFQPPHDEQVVLKISLADFPRSKTAQLYKQLNASGDQLFTLLPEAMDLSQVMTGKITQFSAAVYQGHFEKGGRLLGWVIVTVEKLILSAKLDPQAPEQNQYVVFGEKGEYFAVHVINGKPSYDSILSVKAPYRLGSSICKLRYCPDLDKAVSIDDNHLLQLTDEQPKSGDDLESDDGIFSSIIKVIYFEKDELAH